MCGFCRASYKRCTDCFHTFIAHTWSATYLVIMDATAASLLLHSHSEGAYWTECGNFVESGWLILSQNAIPHKARSYSRHFTNNWLRNVKMVTYSICRRKKKTSRDFAVICRKLHVCAPQFFKTPSGLCGHTCCHDIQMVVNQWLCICFQ
jgi:hypothetical protein